MKLLLFLLLSPVTIFAQTITGHIRDKHHQTLPGATITLLKADSSVIASSTSDTAGFYKLSFQTSDTVFVRVSLTGFITEVKPLLNTTTLDFILPDSSESNLAQASVIEGVKVTARKRIIEYKADRTIFNVENSIAATGGDALDAIKRAPGVLVNNNQITLAGKSSVAIMINGRLQQLSGDDLLQLLHSIPSDNILRIEIITSPSARYDAEGNSGIINLVLKRNKQKGFRGSATLSHEYNTGLNFPTGSFSIYYKKDKLNLFGTVNGGVQGYPYTAYINTYYPDQYVLQNSRYPYVNRFARLQAGGDYMLTMKSNLGFTLSEGFSGLDNREYIIASSYEWDGYLDSTLRTTGKTTDRYRGTLTTNLNYEYRIDSTGRKINIDVDYYRQQGDRHRDFTIESSATASSLTTEKTSRVSSQPLTEIKSAKIDFEMPYKFARIIFGAKASEAYNILNNLFENKTGGSYVNDTTKSNDFNYRETIKAAYITVNKSYKKFEFNIGLRAEHTRGVGVLVTASQTNILEYTKLFPSASVQYKKSEKHVFSMNFARRINRPGYGLLNPFRYYYTTNTYSEGNPLLQPAFNYVTDIGYTYKSKLNVRLLYNRISNYYDARVSFVDTIQKTNAFTRKNIGYKEIANMNISGSFQLAKWWELLGEVNGGFSKFAPFDKSGQSSYTGFYGYIDATNNLYLNKARTLGFELSAYYYSPRQRDYVYWDKMTSVSVGLRHMLLNKNLVLVFYANDIFAQSFWLQTNKQNNTKEFSYDGHSYRMSISYKFGNKAIRAKQVRNMEEIQRTGNQ